jgi:isopenicillin N synthase-like dioxygenase
MTDLATAPAIASASLTESARDPEGFAQEIGRSFERFGFAVIADHGISADLIARAEEKARLLRAPDAVKKSWFIAGGGGARGTPFGIETAKGATAYDLKEFLACRPRAAGRPPLRRADGGQCLAQREVPGFRETFLELFAAFDAAGLRIPRGDRSLSRPRAGLFLRTRSRTAIRSCACSIIRRPGDGAQCACWLPMRDINTITLLLGAEEAGLQLLDRDGNWLPITPNEGELVVNIGDMLQRLTNMKLRSTTHRVVNPPPERRGHSRYSMPFFLHFRPDFLIETLPDCISADHPNQFPVPITAHDYLLDGREIT